MRRLNNIISRWAVWDVIQTRFWYGRVEFLCLCYATRPLRQANDRNKQTDNNEERGVVIVALDEPLHATELCIRVVTAIYGPFRFVSNDDPLKEIIA